MLINKTPRSTEKGHSSLNTRLVWVDVKVPVDTFILAILSLQPLVCFLEVSTVELRLVSNVTQRTATWHLRILYAQIAG